jgi:hypothetical protein
MNAGALLAQFNGLLPRGDARQFAKVTYPVVSVQYGISRNTGRNLTGKFDIAMAPFQFWLEYASDFGYLSLMRIGELTCARRLPSAAALVGEQMFAGTTASTMRWR